MSGYIIKRLSFFLPALLVVSMLVFALSKLTPGDPVQRLGALNGVSGMQEGLLLDHKTYNDIAERLGLDKPVFYFSLTALAYPDTFHRITIRDYQQNLSRLLNKHGNWPEIQEYYHALLQLNRGLNNTHDSLRNNSYIDVRRICGQLFIQHKDEEVSRLILLLSNHIAQNNAALSQDITTSISRIASAYTSIKTNPSIWKLYIPAIKWWGFDNQYHHWITSFMVGNFGTSYMDGLPVARKIGEALWWTLIMNVLSLLLIFLISIPLGVYLAQKKGRRADQYISLFLFSLYSLPRFWVATLLLVFFTTSEYGHFFDIFEGPGLGELRRTAPLADRFWERAGHLILPIFCLTYAALAFVTRQVRGSMIAVMESDFVRTARAKGLSDNKVIWRHAFRNSLSPLITLLAMIVPGLLAGSVIVEYIFAIPGMGSMMFGAFEHQNWPIVYTVLLLIAILTMVTNLLADLSYIWADPRVTLGKSADRTGLG